MSPLRRVISPLNPFEKLGQTPKGTFTDLNGKLISHTLLPENSVLKKIGGKGKEFWIESTQTNYLPVNPTVEDPEKGEWRVEDHHIFSHF